MTSRKTEPEQRLGGQWVLLDGENPWSEHRDDPEHWVAVYSELVESTTRMLDAARERLLESQAAGNADAPQDEREIAALVSRTQHFTNRLRWWVRRGREVWER